MSPPLPLSVRAQHWRRNRLTPLPKRLASLGSDVAEAHARVTRATAMPDRLRALVECFAEADADMSGQIEERHC